MIILVLFRLIGFIKRVLFCFVLQEIAKTGFDYIDAKLSLAPSSPCFLDWLSACTYFLQTKI